MNRTSDKVSGRTVSGTRVNGAVAVLYKLGQVATALLILEAGNSDRLHLGRLGKRSPMGAARGPVSLSGPRLHTDRLRIPPHGNSCSALD